MQSFIESKIRKLYADFSKTAKRVGSLCVLKAFTFAGNSLPDYSNPLVQQLYLLRYFPAYLVEYYLLYEKMIRSDFLSPPLNVFSLGAGPGVDYWGLMFAARKCGGGYPEGLRYTGLDAIDWSYQDNLKHRECWIEHEDILGWNKLDESEYNTIIFPKSIGEFSNRTFQHVRSVLESTEFTEKRICCICSLRDQRADSDALRFTSIAKLLQEGHGYTCLDDPNSYQYWTRPVAIRSLCSEFVYPDDIKESLNSVLGHCAKFRANGNKPCNYDCYHMNRYPILNSRYMKWQILRFERD